ncbi:hypothetical protein NC652_040609 [Populus alba x Populus x berolinensis]|uniref:Uncharacterized protein n=1 Tax=Populus alba x Populus x berolinensis TaxID=444605 RepID=A0AAD6PNE0_9ROSI|nr:hypothetical protein NC652_040609 [Populus alba x Populus x berolinensis]KAJ6951417.1 hypothetical protein NC653_040742 [Populus alba x Populus x berolinensis]
MGYCASPALDYTSTRIIKVRFGNCTKDPMFCWSASCDLLPHK